MFTNLFMNLLSLIGSVILLGLIVIIVALVAAVTYIIVRSIATSCKNFGKESNDDGSDT